MELVLKVYKNQKEVEKEYKIDSYDLMTGFVEDLLKAIDIDQLEGKSGNDLYLGIAKIISKNYGIFYPLAHDMFGITEEEYRRTKVKELAVALAGSLGFSIGQFARLDSKK